MTRIKKSGNEAAELRGEEITVDFGGLKALSEVSIELARGEILGLIGPNGAGKTTLVNVLTGFQKPTLGGLWLDQLELTGKTPGEIANHGVARSFQGVGVFGRMTVAENLEVGIRAAGVRGRSIKPEVERILGAIDMLHIADLFGEELSYGDARSVALARAMAMRPGFLLLDEPAAGLDENETVALMETIRGAREQDGCGILVIEHNMPLIMDVCDRLHVLERGATLAVGAPEQIQTDPRVLAAYLGEDYVAASGRRDEGA